ncbi:MAG: cytochrome b [Herbaspirillum sp.]|nr:cytochrome b [Herbaspirillum sp.]
MNSNRYHPTTIFLHWLIFLLFVVALASIEYRGFVPKGNPFRDTLRGVHVLAGELVFIFFIVRLAVRLRFRAPPAEPAPRWQIGAGHALHGLLYLLMIALPVTGVLFNQAAGRDIAFLGLTLPGFIGVDKALGANIKDIHETLGNMVYYIVGLHAAGALFHHYVMKDGTLRRMLPGARSK